MKILFTNDDGYSAIGIQTLYKTFMGNPQYKTFMSAPMNHKSAFSHAINYADHVSFKKITGNINGFAVDSTPADSVRAAFLGLFGTVSFDLVLSGINHGVNMAQDIFYSGTVAAAREAVFRNTFAIAISLELEDQNYDYIPNLNIQEAYQYAAMITKRIVDALDPEILAYKDSLININFPGIYPAKGIKIVDLGKNDYHGRLDYKGDKIQFQSIKRESLTHTGTDSFEISQGYIVISALKKGVVVDPILQEKIKFLEQISID